MVVKVTTALVLVWSWLPVQRLFQSWQLSCVPTVWLCVVGAFLWDFCWKYVVLLQTIGIRVESEVTGVSWAMEIMVSLILRQRGTIVYDACVLTLGKALVTVTTVFVFLKYILNGARYRHQSFRSFSHNNLTHIDKRKALWLWQIDQKWRKSGVMFFRFRGKIGVHWKRSEDQSF